jgi:type II secretory pathway component PulC
MKRLSALFHSRALALLTGFIFLSTLINAQLKVGDNPTSIQKSSILELESTRQGLLLPRLADTAAINLLTPPDGMIIYLIPDKSLRLRSNGSWKKIADLAAASSNWSLSGNSGTDSAANFLGTLDGMPLIMKTNNAEAMRIDENGNIGIGTNNPTAKLNVNGSVKLNGLTSGTNELDVLVLASNGSVYKRTISSTAFNSAISAINGIQKQSLSITAAASDTSNNVLVQNRAADSTIAIYLPVQNGDSGSSKPYGFLTYSDWQKIQSAVQTVAIGAVASSPNVNGASIVADSTSRTIILHPADVENPGIVTAGTQTFGGNKTFAGNTTLDGTLTLNSLANNNSTDSVLVINNGVVEKRKVSSSTFGSSIASINGNRDTAQVFAFKNSGTDLTVSTNGADSVFLNIPNAGISSRGVVTATSQTFGGNKSFQDSVSVAKTLLAGAAGDANSTLQVSGSVSMSIATITSDYTLTSANSTVLANTTSGAITITLPAPTNIAGRIYTIKKIGTGGIDKELTIAPASGTIDGGVSYVIYNDWTYVTLQTDGTNWYIIKK